MGRESTFAQQILKSSITADACILTAQKKLEIVTTESILNV
jgi:hypothetical protein